MHILTVLHTGPPRKPPASRNYPLRCYFPDRRLAELLARVDLIIDTGDGLRVTDFKTARTSWSEAYVTDSVGQFLLYHELVKEWLTVGRCGLGVVRHTKTPEAALHPVPIDEQQLD